MHNLIKRIVLLTKLSPHLFKKMESGLEQKKKKKKNFIPCKKKVLEKFFELLP
jgi:hypothetical protein